MSLKLIKVHQMADFYQRVPLLIVGPGPSYDLAPKSLFGKCPIFALNHVITQFFRYPKHFWISNDHDRTFQSKAIAPFITKILADYRPWSVITNRKFIPGPFGDIDWVDHRGNPQGPLDWRLPCPDESELYWYHENPGHNGSLYHGESVLELALEIASIWGFNPIVLVGVDLTLLQSKSQGQAPQYYAGPWKWKETPRRILVGHKISDMILSVTKNRDRWPPYIFHTSPYGTKLPFQKLSFKTAQALIEKTNSINEMLANR